MKLAGKRTAVGALVALAAITTLGAWLVGTESGLHAAWQVVSRFVPDDIEIGAIGGRLAGRLVLVDVTFERPDLRAHVERIELDWRPSSLLRRALSVVRLHAAGIDVVRFPGQAEPDDDAPFRLPDELSTPVAIEIELLTVDDLRVRASPDAEALVVDHVRFAFRFRNRTLAVDGFALQAPLLDASGRAEVETGGGYAADIALDATVRPPERPAANAAIRGAGTLDALTVRASIAAPYLLEAEVVAAELLENPTFDGTLRARLVPDEVGLDVPVAETNVELALAGPMDALGIQARADASLPGFADIELDVDARWLGAAVEVERLEITERGGPGALRLAGRIDVEPALSAALAGEWSGLRWPLAGEPVAASPRGSVELNGTPARLEGRIDAGWDTNGRITGVLRRDGERIAAELEWRDVSWPPRAPRLESRRGSLEVSGTLDDYVVTVDAALAATEDVVRGLQASGAAGHVRAEGRGDRRSLDLARVDIAVLDGELDGSARVEWEPSFAAAIDTRFARLDPGLLVPDWGGRVDGVIEGHIAFGDDGFSADVATLDVAGTLRGRPIDLDARGRYDTFDGAALEALTLRSGTSTLVASGRIDERLDVEWELDSGNLEDFWPGLAGKLSTSGHASGPVARPLIEADARGESLAVSGIEIGTLSLAARLDVAGEADSNVALDVTDAHVAGRRIERLVVRGDGTAARHRLSADGLVDGIEATLALRGTVERPWESTYVWRFELDEGRIAHSALPPWTLDGPAAGALTAGGAELERSCLTSGSAALCIEAARLDSRTDVRVDLTELPFAHFAAFLPQDTRVTGTVSGDGRVELAPGGAPRASLTLVTTPARISPMRAGGAVPDLAFAAGRATLELDGSRVDAAIDLPLAREQGGLYGRAAVMLREGEPIGAGSVDGGLEVDLANLAFLSGLVRGVDGTTGALSVDVELSGTVAAPRIAGSAVLTGGGARLRDPGIIVEQIEAAVVGDGSGRLTVDVSAASGDGTLEADGELRFADSVVIGRLALRGEAFEVANTPDARLWASPDLVVDLAPNRIDLTGRVLIPRARFTPRDSIEGAVTVSSDQIIVDAEERPTARLSRPFYARVALSLGDDVTFDGFGLTGKLAGGLEIVEVPSEPVTGSGELRVESGTYEAYGQELEVRTGRLLFAGGPVSRPGLDIEAVRRPTEDILVGARVRGTLDRPELSVFSEPPMQRSEQLSYLLLGRPLETASGSETSALSQAAMALGLRGGNFVSERLNQALGFDEFGIQSQPAQANSASFVIGKYLTPSLYVSYGVGLFEPVNTLRLRYTISRRWRLVTESSTAASGGDLIYHIERGN